MKRARPARFILWHSRGEFYVSERGSTTLLEIERLEHFFSFHSTEESAWTAAVEQQKFTVERETERLKSYRRRVRQARRAKMNGVFK